MNSPNPIYEGCLEFAGVTHITGWARCVNHTGEPVELDILVDGRLFSTVKADEFRQDLLDAGKGNGCCGFVFPIPRQQFRDNKIHSIHVKISGTDIALASTPKDVFFPYDLSEPLPQGIMDDVTRVTSVRRSSLIPSHKRYQLSPMKIHIV